MCRLRKEGYNIREISRDLKIPYSTVRDCLFRMRQGNPKKRFDKKRRGRKRLLTRDDNKEIKKWLRRKPSKYGFEAGSWQLNMVRIMLKRERGIVCTTRMLRRALRRVGYSYRKQRPVPRDSASPKEQEEFKEENGKLLAKLRAKGYVVVQDEAHILLWTGPNYAWRRTNGNDEIPTSFSKKSVTVFGVLGEDGYRLRTAEACNTREFKKFLREMIRIYKKIVIVLDNAAYHKSKSIQNMVKDSNGNLVLIYLPPPTPQLNPIEQQWNVLKRLLSGRHFSTIEELKNAIAEIARRRLMKPVKLMEYLLVKQ